MATVTEIPKKSTDQNDQEADMDQDIDVGLDEPQTDEMINKLTEKLAENNTDKSSTSTLAAYTKPVINENLTRLGITDEINKTKTNAETKAESKNEETKGTPGLETKESKPARALRIVYEMGLDEANLPKSIWVHHAEKPEAKYEIPIDIARDIGFFRTLFFESYIDNSNKEKPDTKYIIAGDCKHVTAENSFEFTTQIITHGPLQDWEEESDYVSNTPYMFELLMSWIMAWRNNYSEAKMVETPVKVNNFNEIFHDIDKKWFTKLITDLHSELEGEAKQSVESNPTAKIIYYLRFANIFLNGVDAYFQLKMLADKVYAWLAIALRELPIEEQQKIAETKEFLQIQVETAEKWLQLHTEQTERIIKEGVKPPTGNEEGITQEVIDHILAHRKEIQQEIDNLKFQHDHAVDVSVLKYLRF